jgi:hypothetical protein
MNYCINLSKKKAHKTKVFIFLKANRKFHKGTLSKDPEIEEDSENK